MQQDMYEVTRAAARACACAYSARAREYARETDFVALLQEVFK